ncbi:putative alcohol oxidase [Hypoxylon sp. FL1284]|nr:putative alcohol oxidase [Hypoxylon sp. FL1284]
MGLLTKIPEGLDQVDIIIAGGGTSACVLAARLSDADPKLSILVVEAGPNNESPLFEHPACFVSHLAPVSKSCQFYETKKSANVANRNLILPTGSVLGGGSSINMMIYSRAQRSDWDSWKTPGWSADEMIPYFKKMETYHGKDEKDIHGRGGPIHVSHGLVAAAAKIGLREVDDLADLSSVDALWRAPRFISPEGKRQDSASCYIHPRLRDQRHPNLHIVVETQVRPNPLFHPGEEGSERNITARKLVIVSCGACGTPSLLERSGTGEPKVLERVGIQVAIDLPGVGSGYEDHHMVCYPYENALRPEDTLDALLAGRMGSWEDVIRSKHKILGWNGQETQAKIRPTEAEVAALGPDFQKAWNEEYRDYPDKPLGICALLAAFPDVSEARGGPCMAMASFTTYPFSRGSIHITGPRLEDPVDFETGFFDDAGQLDVKKHVWLYKKQRELMRRMSSYRGEMAKYHPQFAASSAAACRLFDGPLAEDVPNIEYSAEDDAVIERWVRENVATTWHSLGTCKMRPREQMGVVDGTLGVYGARGLKLAALSIAPRNVAANTNHTALAVGEKAADIFIKELGLESS